MWAEPMNPVPMTPALTFFIPVSSHYRLALPYQVNDKNLV
jgi:hypothetical protein